MDKNTFAENIRKSELTLYRVSKSILINESDCGDAVQEAIYKAFKNLHTLKEEQYFQTWITRILIRECYKILKRNKRFTPYEDYMDETVTIEDNRQSSEVFTALMQLKDELRIVTVLYYINGFSTVEIAKILGVPKGTVNSRMARARKKLKSILEQEGIDVVWVS